MSGASTTNLKRPERGYVIVSMSNLFHIFDKERITEKLSSKEPSKDEPRKLKETKTNDQLLEDAASEHRLMDKTDAKLNKTTNEMKSIQTDATKSSKQDIGKKHSSCCDYFFNLVLFLFFLLIFNSSFVWVLYYILAHQKNNYYCFDSFSKGFKVCSKDDFCPTKGISNFIFTDKISDVNVTKEAEMINEKYLDFYIKETGLFSLLNKKFSKTAEISSYYTIVIVVTKKEGFLFSNTFRTTCETNIVDFIIILVIGMVCGNFFFGYMADIFGRKKILIVCLFVQVIGGMVVFGQTYYILKQGEEHGNEKYIVEDQMFKFDFTTYPAISDFVQTDSNRPEYNMNNLNNIYEEKFNEIKGDVLKSNFIRLNYKKYNLFIFVGFFFIFLGNSPVFTISLAYLMENALTEDSMNLYYLFFHFSYPFSILLGSALVTLLDSFHYPILGLSCVQFCMILILMFGFYESQRFNFEYSFYTRITEFTAYILGWDNLKYNYRERIYDSGNEKIPNLNKEVEQGNAFTIYYNENSPKIATELKYKNENEKSTLLGAFIANKIKENIEKVQILKQKKTMLRKGNRINRQQILSYPITTINSLMGKEKQIKNHLLIIFSFISSISIVFNLALTKVTSSVFLPRHILLTRTVFQTWIFGYFLLFYVILYPFIYFIVKFLGISVILFPSLIVILVFSGIFEIIGLLPREQNDLNIYAFGSFDIAFRDHANALITCNVFVLIAAVGLLYSMYFYLTKLTRTIYRCSFYGICQIFIDLTMIISISLDNFIEKTYFYTCLFAIIGIINSYFITSNEDTLNITEIRKIVFDDVKSNKQNK